MALEELETQRNGLVFIYNMSNSKYSNFDYELSQKMLTMLKGKSKKCFQIKLDTQYLPRVLSCQAEKGFDSHGSSLVQSSLQGEKKLLLSFLALTLVNEAFSLCGKTKTSILMKRLRMKNLFQKISQENVDQG